jgi:hypothetical protein
MSVMLIQISSVLVCAYLILAIIVFDFTKPAFSNDEDNFRGRAVAFGPCPREAFRSQRVITRGAYSGDEWYWFVFRPICFVWRFIEGYETPAEFR